MADEDQAKIEAQAQLVVRRLREAREKVRISQMDLSFLAGLSQNQVNCIESGKRNPTLNTLLRLCAALGISPARLFEPEDEERRRARETVVSLVGKYMV